MVMEIYDPTGKKIIKQFKYDMEYQGGYMSKEDAREIGRMYRQRGHRIFIFTPQRSHGARGYPFNLWVSRLPVKLLKKRGGD
jgi:hypothetical protein